MEETLTTNAIDECLDQLTALLRAAGKCQPCDTPRKVTLAKRELSDILARIHSKKLAVDGVMGLTASQWQLKHSLLRDKLRAVLDAD